MKKIIDYSLIPKDIDLKNIKVLNINCANCNQTASIKFSDTIEVTQEMFDWVEIRLKQWSISHSCLLDNRHWANPADKAE